MKYLILCIASVLYLGLLQNTSYGAEKSAKIQPEEGLQFAPLKGKMRDNLDLIPLMPGICKTTTNAGSTPAHLLLFLIPWKARILS